MITLADVRDYLKSFNLFNGYYVGRIDASKKNVLGVYDLKGNRRHKTIGKGTQKYDIKGVSLLIHGDTNKTNTEKLAISLYEALENVEEGKIAGRKINITGKAYFQGDICPDIRTICGGKVTCNDVDYSINAGSKALNFDGTVNYTELELV